MDFNTNSGVKRPAECDMANQLSSSKLPQIANISIAVGAEIHAEGNSRVSIGNINMVHQQILQQQPTPEEPPCGIEFQVADPVDTFRGREQVFHELKQAFDKQKNMKPYNLVAVCGYGGIGKTQFARMYIKKNQTDFKNVVWIFAESVTTMTDSFNMLQNQLNDSGYRCYGHQDIYKLLNSDMNVFVFDNSENIRSIQSFLPAKHNKSLFLITSKSKNWHSFNTIELNELDMKDAEAIMKAVLVDTHKIVISDKQLKELVKKFEPVPLVLQIRAGFICQKVRYLRKRGSQYNIEDILNKSDIKHNFVTEIFHNFFLDPYDKSIFDAVFQTLEKIWNGKDNASKTAANILGISAYLHAGIEEDILKNILQIKNENLFNDSLDILEQFSLFRIDGMIRIHRTVQQCLQYYQKIIKESNECLLLALHILSYDDFLSSSHHETVFKHMEKDFELFYRFYEENKCKYPQLNMVIAQSAPCIMLTQLLNKVNILKNPDILCSIIASGRDNINQILLDLDVDYDAKDEQGFGLFHYACIPNDIKMFFYRPMTAIKTLITVGADINSPNSNGCTVLHTLCALGKNNSGKDQDIYVACTLLIKEGANPDIRNNNGLTPADLAQEFELILTFKLLDSVIPGGLNLLHIVAETKHFKLLLFLINRREFDINQRDNTGCTILHVLAGLDQDIGDEDNPLYGKASVLWRKFRDINIDFSAVNNSGETPEDVARRCGRRQLPDFLIAHVQPGRNIYRTASFHERLEYFRFVSTGDMKHVNEQDDTGCTLLHTLCCLHTHNDTELELDLVKLIAHLLIECDANVHIRNKENHTAAEVARRHSHYLLADFLDRRASNTAASAASVELVYVALKHNIFALIKYAWWRYLNYLSRVFLYKTLNSLGCRVLRVLCESENPTVNDVALINLIDCLDLQHMAKYNKDGYHRIVGIAKQHGREKLAAWLQAHV